MSMIITQNGCCIDNVLLKNYFHSMINHFFKILPMKETGEQSLAVYMKSLQMELLGCHELIPEIKENSMFLTLLSILQYLIDNPDCSTSDVKREVFRAISICNKLETIYSGSEGLDGNVGKLPKQNRNI